MRDKLEEVSPHERTLEPGGYSEDSVPRNDLKFLDLRPSDVMLAKGVPQSTKYKGANNCETVLLKNTLVDFSFLCFLGIKARFHSYFQCGIKIINHNKMEFLLFCKPVCTKVAYVQ